MLVLVSLALAALLEAEASAKSKDCVEGACAKLGINGDAPAKDTDGSAQRASGRAPTIGTSAAACSR